MRRVPVCNLTIGLVLNEPLYSKGKKLLLAPGKRLTSQMFAALKGCEDDFVFMGKWDDKTALRYGAASHVSELRSKADKVIDSLRSEYDERLKSLELSPTVSGPALAHKINRTIPEERNTDHINKFMVMKQEGEQFVEDTVNGWTHEDEVGKSAYAITEKFSQAMCEDPNLLNLLAQAKNSDTYLFGHSVNVSLLSMQIGTTLGFGHEQIMDIGTSALLQDLGMAMVPDTISMKPDKLTQIEMLDIQKHTYNSVYLIERFQGIPLLSRFLALQCHERINGNGYPRKRPDSLIHRFAKIVSVADVYESLISDRPWRKGFAPHKAMEQLIRWTSTGQYESDAVKGLLYTLSLYPIGTFVKLSNNETARVISSNGMDYSKPVVAVIIDATGAHLSEPHQLDLSDQKDIAIVEVLDDLNKDTHKMTAFAV